MDTLQEIARIIGTRPSGRKLLETLSTDSNDSVISSYLRDIIDQQYSNDDDAARALYDSDRNDQRYRTLKSRAFERLMQGLLLIDIRKPTHSEYQASYHRCARNLIAARTLCDLSSRAAATRLAEKTLLVSTRFQFTEITLSLLMLLRQSYALVADRKRFLECSRQISECFELLHAELRSDELHFLFQMESRRYPETNVATANLLSNWLNQHEELVQRFSSHKIQLNFYRFLVGYHGVRKEIDKLNAACDAAREYLSNHAHWAEPSRVGAFGLSKIRANIASGSAQLILDEISTVIDCFPKGSPEWYAALEYGTIAFAHCEQYERAYQLWKQGNHNRYLVRASQTTRDMWGLFEVFMFLLAKMGLLPLRDGYNELAQAPELLHTVPMYSKDNDRFTSHVFIAQAIFHTLNGEHESAIRRIEQLKVYRSHYGKNGSGNIVNLFAKLLAVVARSGMKSTKIPTDTNHIVEKLRHSNSGDAIHGAYEIVPFHLLYTNLLRCIDQS